MPKAKGRGLTKTQKKQVKKLVEAPEELKRCLVRENGVVSDTAGNFSNLLNIGQGVDGQSRIGDIIRPKKLFFDLTLAGSTSVAQAQSVRVLLIKYGDISTVINTKLELLANFKDPVPYDLSYKGNYQILMDKTILLGNPSATLSNPSMVPTYKHLRFVKKLTGKSQFSTGGTPVGNDFSNMSKGAYALFMISSSAGLASYNFTSALDFADA